MTSMNTTTAFSGRGNQGFQLGSNSGNIYINDHGQPEGSWTTLKPSSTVPFRRDPDFVDRDILVKVGKKLSEPASRAALVGLGGVGKSQLAIEYAYRIKEEFPQTWIFWVHASNAARFEEGYRIIADRIKLPRRDEPTTDILQLVSNWLCDEANGRWIMIVDNADDSAVFSDPRKGRLQTDTSGAISLSTFLPQTPNGSILVTSRSVDAALTLIERHHDIIKVEPMDEDCALLLFEKKRRGGFDKDDAKQLLRALDYMPLAISQAAAYICQRAPRTTVAKYLDEFRKSDRNRANLLNRNAPDIRRDSQASNSIMATWQLSFEYIRRKRPSAARLLSLMSFFDRQGIPEFMLHHYDDREDDKNIDPKDEAHIGLEDESDMGFEEDVSTLTNYSLITTIKHDYYQFNQFEMHRLVQFSTRKWLELNNELEMWKKKYIRILSVIFPPGRYEYWALCQVLFPHAEAVLAHQPAERKYLIYRSDVLHNAAWYAVMQENYSMAEEMSRRALNGMEMALGKEHPYTLTSVNNLALVLRHQGKYEAAEKMSRQALDGREEALGKEHPGTLLSVNNLAVALHIKGKYEAAEKMDRRALEGLEKALGKEHPNTLTSVNNLAMVMQDLGKYEAAEKMIRRALDGREKVLGKEHPDTLTSVYNLAMIIQHQGKYEAAEKMFRRVLEGLEKTLGKGHPETLASGYFLACILHRQKQYTEAITFYERTCAGSQKVLGTNHAVTLASFQGYISMIAEMKANSSNLGR